MAFIFNYVFPLLTTKKRLLGCTVRKYHLEISYEYFMSLFVISLIKGKHGIVLLR